MIDFGKIIGQMTERLGADEYFDDFKLISAFEPLQKPTVPERPAVICGILQASAQTAALGEDVQAGQITAFADIYVPFDLRGFNFQQAAGRVFCALCSDTPVSIGVQAVREDDDSECFVMRLTVTFSDMFIFDND